MELPKRKTIRLKDYDYSENGAYFVTICAKNKEHIFGEIVSGINMSSNSAVWDGFPVPPALELSRFGEIVENHIGKINEKHPTVHVDKYIIMPNHMHVILIIDNANWLGGGTGDPSPTLGNVIAWFKYQTTKQMNIEKNTQGIKCWQRSYHDHIIRNEKSYKQIWQYIDQNPQTWEDDCYYINTGDFSHRLTHERKFTYETQKTLGRR